MTVYSRIAELKRDKKNIVMAYFIVWQMKMRQTFRWTIYFRQLHLQMVRQIQHKEQNEI